MIQIRDTETHRYCDFCGTWITHKNWFPHRSTKSHMNNEAKNENHPLIKLYNREEELTRLNRELKVGDTYDVLTYQTTVTYDMLQKEISKNNFVNIKCFDGVKQNDSFVYNESETMKPNYFYFCNGFFQSLDNDKNLFIYVFDLRHNKCIIFKANKLDNVNTLTSVIQKLDVKEYVRKVFLNEDEYTDEVRMRIFWKNMQNLRERVSSDITINEVKELELFKDYDFEKYELTNDGFAIIKKLRLENHSG